MSAILIDNLTKRSRRETLLDNLNLEVLDGEFYTLLGTKDSGKETLTKILMGILKANSGQALIYDMDTFKESKEIKESVSFVSKEIFLPDNMRAMSVFKKTLASHNLKSTEDIDLLAKYFDFDPRYKFGEMNERERKLLQIINALIIRPRLIILDDPTNSLNADDKDLLFSHLVNINRGEGTTVFLLTDSLIEAKKYSKRIAYMYKGQIKDVEFNNEKTTYDKILKIDNYRGNLSYFTQAGARLIKDSDAQTILYYDGDLTKLSEVIYDERLENYTLENANLEDKLCAYYEDAKFKEIRKKDNIKKTDFTESKDISVNTNIPQENIDNDKTFIKDAPIENNIDAENNQNNKSEEIFSTSENANDDFQNTNIILGDKNDTSSASNQDTIVIKKGKEIDLSDKKEDQEWYFQWNLKITLQNLLHGQ